MLYAAAANGDCRRLGCCIAAGCWLEARNEYGQTALLLAAWRGQPAAVSLLLHQGANLAGRANDGCSPAEAAAAAGHDAVIAVLCQWAGSLHPTGSPVASMGISATPLQPAAIDWSAPLEDQAVWPPAPPAAAVVRELIGLTISPATAAAAAAAVPLCGSDAQQVGAPSIPTVGAGSWAIDHAVAPEV